MIFGNLGNIGGPIPPVFAGAAFLYDPRPNRPGPFQKRENELLLRGVLLLWRVRGFADVGTLWRGAAGKVIDHDFQAAADILPQRHLIDGGVETLIVGSQRVQNLPDNPIPFVVVQGLFGRDVGRHPNGQNHIAQVFALCLPHHPPNRLHHLDLAFARVQKHDAVKGRHIHPL